MGDLIDLDGLTAAGRLWEKGQRQDDETTRQAWEGVSGRMFFGALGMRGAQRQPRPPTLPGREGGGRNGR